MVTANFLSSPILPHNMQYVFISIDVGRSRTSELCSYQIRLSLWYKKIAVWLEMCSVNMGQQKPDYKVISVQEDTAWHVNLIQTSM